MREYYFLASLLPQLEIGHVPPLGFDELKGLLRVNLAGADQQLVKELLRQIDYENICSYWAHEEIDPRGNLTLPEIEQALQDLAWPRGEEFPDFFIDYLKKYHTNEERLAHFQILLSQFYDHQVETYDGFIGNYYAFQKEWKLVLLGFRAKLLQRDLLRELQYEDPADPFVAQILAQKDSKVYEPPFEYRDLRPLLEHTYENPLDLHKALYEYQFNRMVEVWGGDLFTIDRILNYIARLILVERWMELDVRKGIEVIDQIESEVK